MKALDYDIIVAGGGTAGAAAAIAAARRGWHVLLVEEQNCLGGTSTTGGVGEWFASLEGMGDIFDTTVRELERFGARYGNQKVFNHEYLKIIWQLLAEQAGVELLFHASVFGVSKDSDTLTEVQIACASQILAARARFFIDATGEGDLSYLAGAPFMQGDPDSGAVLHMTLTAWLYDTGEIQEPYLPEGLTPISGPEELPGLGTGWVVDAHRVYLNATKVMGHDPTDPFSLSAAEREARRQLTRVVAYVQCHKFPTYALAATGASIGIREGRRILGEHVLTQDEILNRTDPLIFEDGIAVGTSQVDFHSLTQPGASGWRKRVAPYNIPFRCLMVKGFPNLLTAGKCISTDQVVHSSCRMTPTCCATGQAAGTAAALALEMQVNALRDISVPRLRAILSTEGIELDPRKHQAYAPNDELS
ncbi:MAG: FAD-dependent oxidoreductase [Anaerolineae bacterium]|jgi:hypothetical protein|nr:FAD-dependent oxidoreductase [Anaerolineae bacterium]